MSETKLERAIRLKQEADIAEREVDALLECMDKKEYEAYYEWYCASGIDE